MFAGPGFLEALFVLIVMAAVPVGIVVGGFLFLRRFLRAYEKKAAAPRELEELRSQVSELQEQVADLTIEASDLRNAQLSGRKPG